MRHELHTAPSRQHADDDLSRRSQLSGLAYLTLFGIILTFTPYAQDHTALAIAVSAIIATCAGLRFLLIYHFNRFYPRFPQRWLACFSLLTLTLAVTWGLFSAHTLQYYSLEWTAMLALLSTAGISSGAITTLSIHRPLVSAYLALLLLPPIVAALLLQSKEGYAITLVLLVYYTFMLSVAKGINSAYWSALNNTLLLNQRTRELEASNQELETYSYSIAHDLRTPLRSIIGFSQILKDKCRDKLGADDYDGLERIIRAGKHMALLIDDILDLSRITRRNIEQRDIDLSRLVQKQVDILADIAPGRAISINIQPELSARGDYRLLSVALQNLMENAWKFTLNQPRAEITFRSQQQDRQTVYCLCDNGVGFDMEHAGNLFKPFERLHRSGEFPGTGIGLATVQRVIARHGGRIWAESAPDKGTCFYFTLGP